MDFEYLKQFSWCRHEKGRFQACAKPIKGTWLHRLIAERAGMAIDGLQVDHHDRDPSNNQRDNLRVATNGGNRANSRLNRDNKSGFKGVHSSRGKWHSQINTGGKKIFLGRFDTPEEAHKVYKEAALLYHGEFANPATEERWNDQISSSDGH